jgi:integrase
MNYIAQYDDWATNGWVRDMTDVQGYIEAGTRANTRRSYQAAVTHFEVTWGGSLPATSDSIARYLADFAGTLTINTLKQRLAGLSQWHVTQGFPDPTKTPIVRKVLKGIRAVHGAGEKQAAPLQLQHLEQAVQYLSSEAAIAQQSGDRRTLLRSRRDAALLLIGFWRGFRSDELCRLEVEHVTAKAGEGMSIFLPQSKGDRENRGATYSAPALARLCPVEAYLNWLTVAGMASGPVFRRVDRWGNVGKGGMNPESLVKVLQQTLQRAGIQGKQYTTHSLRRGFATWAAANGWDIKALMLYVGWKDMKSAIRYIDPVISFGGLAVQPALGKHLTQDFAAPKLIPPPGE